MEPIKLNDLLHIDYESKDFYEGRITFNTEYEGRRHIDNWLENPKHDDIERCYFSLMPYGTGKNPKRYLHEGNLLIILVQLESRDRWLLANIVRVKKVYDYIHGNEERRHADVEIVDKYKQYCGRVIVRCSKKAQGYNKTIRTFLDRCEVESILPKEYGGKPFPGYKNICIKMRDLITYIYNENLGEDWKAKLSSVKGIYCLNNHDEHKVYIGSAYNDKSCLLGRWQDYFDSLTGGNVSLKKLFKDHKNNPDYFLDNFYFSILETFSIDINDKDILEREHYWMNVFNSRQGGYNNN